MGGTEKRGRQIRWGNMMGKEKDMKARCKMMEARKTRTSRARIRPFTRICCCRSSSLRAGDEGVRLTPSILLSQSPVAPWEARRTQQSSRLRGAIRPVRGHCPNRREGVHHLVRLARLLSVAFHLWTGDSRRAPRRSRCVTGVQPVRLS